MKKLKLDRLTSTRFNVNELSKIKGGLLWCSCGPAHPCFCMDDNEASDMLANNEHASFYLRAAQ
jgi:hypothetical protein